jgi:PAS domain S-box-containing protein
MLRYSYKELVKKNLWEMGAFKDINASKDAFEKLQENEYIRFDDLPLKTKAGKLIQVEFVSNVYLVGGEKVVQCNIRDITDYKMIVTALQRNEKKYHDLVNQSPDGIFIIGLAGNIISANKTMCEELDFTEEELLSMKVLDIVPEEYLDQYRERLEKMLEGEHLGEAGEYEVRGKNGKNHYVEVLSTPYYNGKNIVGFQGIARDITKRKLAEKQLRYQASLLKNVNDAIVATDSENRITAWNKAAESLYGWKADEVIGRDGMEVFSTKWPDGDDDKMTRAIASTHQWHGEATQVRKNGTTFTSELSLFVLNDENGKDEAHITVNRDISERIRSEEALKLANSQLTNLYDNLPEAVFSIDFVANKMLQASQAHEK